MPPVGTNEPEAPIKAEAVGLRFSYGAHEVLKGISMPFRQHRITALIGPSGCGKSTFLRCFNRIHDLYSGIRYGGELRLYPDNIDLLGRGINPILLRLRINMVFQKPNPFPKSVFENVAFGPRLLGVKRKDELAHEVETALRSSALWEEVKDRLHEPALRLSGGQQQRLCIARSLAARPEIILLDEPTSALDPIATGRIEDLMLELRERITMIIVTHNLQQAARISDATAFMYLGELVEHGETSTIFMNPTKQLTQQYVTGSFG
ncbi:MAG: phosphate ABC transporter ATP-binding protein [Planctomycetes bacterium]|nr:phosphate ABC transporter ATP-binding protein [Planctomycetota bacterium]